MNKITFAYLTVFLAFQADLFAQDRTDKTAVTYEKIYDEPFAVNKLFIGLQPLYGELFVANVNAGFGIEAQYYFQDKVDFRAQFRKTYSRKFFDLTRDLALDNLENSNQENRAQVFNYFELGATYHIKDFEEASKSKMVLYKKSYKGNRWASRVPLNVEIPGKVRKIYGLRAGGIVWDSSTDLTRAMSGQQLSNADLKDAEGNGLPLTHVNKEGREEPLNVYSNISSRNVYLGGSMSWIRNIAIAFDNYEEGVDDLMFTAFVDIIYAPALSVDDIVYTSTSTGTTRTYSVSPVKLQSFGARAGIDGKFNRTFSWAYGAEVGYRPSIEGRSFYALLKISFPIFGSTLDYKVESFEK